MAQQAMNLPRLLMSASALVLGILGIACTFAPEELLARMGEPVTPPLALVVQIIGALYFGFAVLNWMARDNLIGGIYSRPVAIGNLWHFLIAGLAILKLLAVDPGFRALWPLAVIYAVFATCFGLILFRHPVRATVS